MIFLGTDCWRGVSAQKSWSRVSGASGNSAIRASGVETVGKEARRVPDFTVDVQGIPTILKRVEVLTVLGNDVAADFRKPHVDLTRCLVLAQRAFSGYQGYFRSRAIAWSKKCQRYVSLVQSVLIYGTEGFTWDADSIHRLHVFEGRSLYRMAAPKKPDGASWHVWKPALLDKLRTDFMKQGCQSIVQRVLFRLWSLGRDVAGYFSTDWDPAYATCADSRKRRRLEPGLQVAACRAWQDARRLLMCSTTEWERRRSEASEALRGRVRYSQDTSLKRRRRGGVAAGEHPLRSSAVLREVSALFGLYLSLGQETGDLTLAVEFCP